MKQTNKNTLPQKKQTNKKPLMKQLKTWKFLCKILVNLYVWDPHHSVTETNE